MSKLITQILPNPKLEKRGRRSFTVEYKLSILQQADACQHGELGPLLRREKLYSNQLAQWRREFAEQGVAGLNKSQPGPAASKTAEQSALNSWKKNLDVCAISLTLRTAASRSKKKPWHSSKPSIRRTRSHDGGRVITGRYDRATGLQRPEYLS